MATITFRTSYNERKDILFELQDDRGEHHTIALNQESVQTLTQFLFSRVIL